MDKITLKLIKYFMLIITLIVAIALALSSIFLSEFYLEQQYKSLEDSAERIQQLLNNNESINDMTISAILIKNENIESFSTLSSFDGIKVVAEIESAGESVVNSDIFFENCNYTAVESQARALMEVFSGTAQACVIDYVTSIGMIGENTDYNTLTILNNAFAEEEYGIAFRKGSDIVEKVNNIITSLYQDGTLTTIAQKYKLENQLIAYNQ
jgi:polar amino acid transport system substrate-binding protein